MKPQERPLWTRVADTKEGNEVLSRARSLSFKHRELSDGELIRLAYWDASGSAEQ